MNQLRALAMNEGYRWKKKLISEQGQAQLGVRHRGKGRNGQWHACKLQEDGSVEKV
jgi:hypothetical protein